MVRAAQLENKWRWRFARHNLWKVLWMSIHVNLGKKVVQKAYIRISSKKFYASIVAAGWGANPTCPLGWSAQIEIASQSLKDGETCWSMSCSNWCFKMFQDVSRCFKMFQDVSRVQLSLAVLNNIEYIVCASSVHQNHGWVIGSLDSEAL